MSFLEKLGLVTEKELKRVKKSYENMLVKKEQEIEELKERNRILIRTALKHGIEQKEIIERLKKGMEE